MSKNPSPDGESPTRTMTTTMAQRRTPRPIYCAICNTAIDEPRRIAPEAATYFVQLCGIACHQAWRESQPVVARLAARGRDLSVGE